MVGVIVSKYFRQICWMHGKKKKEKRLLKAEMLAFEVLKLERCGAVVKRRTRDR